MALSANAWIGSSLAATACAAVNNGACTPARTLSCPETLLLILDALEREGGVDISTATSDDLSNVTKNALCALQSISYPPIDADKLKALVLWAVNQEVALT